MGGAVHLNLTLAVPCLYHPQVLRISAQSDSVVWCLSGAEVGGPVERGSVQRDGGNQRLGGSTVCCQHSELTARPGPGSGLLQQQGLFRSV